MSSHRTLGTSGFISSSGIRTGLMLHITTLPESLPWPPVANLEPSGCMSTENIGLPSCPTHLGFSNFMGARAKLGALYFVFAGIIIGYIKINNYDNNFPRLLFNFESCFSIVLNKKLFHMISLYVRSTCTLYINNIIDSQDLANVSSFFASCLCSGCSSFSLAIWMSLLIALISSSETNGDLNYSNPNAKIGRGCMDQIYTYPMTQIFPPS